jgi:hypothetical protein
LRDIPAEYKIFSEIEDLNMQMKSKLNPITNNAKKVILISLFLSFLVTPVFGYSSGSDDPKDYALTEFPTNYLSDNNEGYWRGTYTQGFYPVTNEGKYIPNKEIYVRISTFPSYYDAETMIVEFENAKKELSINNNGDTEIDEIYGFGDKSYKITYYDEQTNIKYLIFVKNHIIIHIRDTFGTTDYSKLVEFANLYDNKTDSILDNQPQMFANIDLEDSIYYAGDSFTYTITLSEDANVVIENQINDEEWTFVGSRTFYEKGQHTVYGNVESNKLGNEKIKLTATSLKGSTATSTVSFISKEAIKEAPPEEILYEITEEIPTETSTSIPQTPGFSIIYVLFMGFLAYYNFKKV